MSTTVNFQLIGIAHGKKEKIRNSVIDALAPLPGRCHVQLIGDQSNDVWELRVSAPGIEASEFLDGALGHQEPEFITAAVKRIVNS